MPRSLPCIALLLAPLALTACGDYQPQTGTRSVTVTATAYTSAERETKKGNVGLAAWGDHLKPGTKAIAVSRDLIPKGLTHGTRVSIQGLDGKYRVLDKMNKRWTDKIDIFMGKNREKARNWGKKEVKISWNVSDDTP